MKRKKTYGFALVLTVPTLSVEECDVLYEAGCDDGTIVTRNGATFIQGLQARLRPRRSRGYFRQRPS